MGEPNISDEELLTALRDLADDLDAIPTVTSIRAKSPYSYDTYWRRFGSITEALKAAGLDPDSAPGKRGRGPIDEAELIEDLQRLGDELGRRPTQADINEHGRFSSPTYYNHFESLTAALEMAGFDVSPSQEIPEEDLLRALRALADELGRAPTGVDMDEQGAYSVAPYRRRFGGWIEALDAAEIN